MFFLFVEFIVEFFEFGFVMFEVVFLFVEGYVFVMEDSVFGFEEIGGVLEFFLSGFYSGVVLEGGM